MFEIKRANKKVFIGDENNALAEMDFIYSENDIIKIKHTLVSEEVNGQGIGKLLLQEVVDWAREDGKKIVPICPYAKAQMERNESYHDVLIKDVKEK